MPTTRVDGWEFAYEEHGSGEPVVLLHGLLMDRSMWEPQVAVLEGRARVVVVDAPGHGESPARDTAFSFEDESRALVELAGALGIAGPAVWVGHSMGGMKALRVALASPDRVRGLVLIDAQPFPENPEAKAQYEALLEVTKAQGPSEDLASIIGTIMFGADFLATAEGLRWVRAFATLDGFRIEGAFRSVADRTDVSDRLSSVRAPTLVIHGVDDTPIPIEVARTYAPMIAGAELVEVAGSGHTTPCERPEEVNRAILAFLDRIGS